jgi:hypothetical protein
MSGIKNSADALGAEVATALYGVTGSGIKIGIISDSYDADGGAAANVAAGDLPPNVVAESDSTTGTDEGQAMIELAYQGAPGASYYFATVGDSIRSFAAAVTSLQAAGVNIIVDDVSFPTEESFYQTGTVLDDAIETAVASGVNYFAAAGNAGDDYVQQGFSPISTVLPGISADPVTANNFGGASPYQDISIREGVTVTIALQWAQPFATIGTGSAGAQNSLAFYLINSQGQIVASSTEVELGRDPVQAIQFINDTGSTQFRLVVVENGGTTPTGQLFTISVLDSVLATLEGAEVGTGSGDIMGHALLPGVNAVGAVTYDETPAFGVSPAIPAAYTATGPGTILYSSSGATLSATATTTARAPAFLSVSGSSTTVAGFSSFNGTSAAAPNAAAVGALILQANGALTTTEVTALLEQSAIPVATALDDAGAGLIQARAAVELAVAAAGSVWSHAGGGAWSAAASWSTDAVPTDAGSVMLGNDLGGIAGSYVVAVNTPGATAGSLTLSAPAGAGVTLSIGAGDGLAIGGPATADITAGDFLVASGGTLSLTGGTLSVAGSLNNNDGTVGVTAGRVTASNFTQDAGSLALSGGTITLTGTIGLAATGGTLSVGDGATLDTTTASLSGTALSIAGQFDDTGTLTGGDGGGTITIAPTGSLSIGQGAAAVGIAFSGGDGLLDFTSADSTVLTGELTAAISGFDDGSCLIEFGALTYNPLDTASYANGALTIADGATDLVRLTLDSAEQFGTFTLSAGAADQLELAALACFAAGTRLLTDRGAMPVEALAVGDRVVTADGDAEAIAWIGARRVDCRRHPAALNVRPVRIAADAFGEGMPGRDLFLSPDHAVFAEGVLIPVKHLIDGGAIRQTEVAQVTYFHVELRRHQILLAEGLPVESYLDTGDRAGFAGGSVVTLHPSWDARSRDAAFLAEGLAYAPIRVMGAEVDHLRARLAGLRRDQPRGGASKTRLTA